jgi:hypothetical protein
MLVLLFAWTGFDLKHRPLGEAKEIAHRWAVFIYRQLGDFLLPLKLLTKLKYGCIIEVERIRRVCSLKNIKGREEFGW